MVLIQQRGTYAQELRERGAVEQRKHRTMPSNQSAFDLTNFLLGLAWLGELDRRQIAQLWFNDKSESTVQKTLTELRKDELITPRSWSVRDDEKGVTAPQLARWSLTPKGHALVKPSAQYPTKPSHPRQRRLVEHDARTIATVVHLLLVARRTGLRGVFLRYEVRLAPDRPRPIADAFVCIQTGASGAAPNIVPWSNDPALHDEERWRFVIEGDNATEPAATIRGKGEAYRQLFSDPQWRHAWQAQFGPLPFVLWVVPEEARSTVIREHFSAGTHQGLFYLTTDAGLTENRWLQVEHGQVKRVGLQMPAPALPPPPPSLPALPAPGPSANQVSARD